MKKLIFLFTAILFFSCSSQAEKIIVENTSDVDRLTEIVEVPVEKLKLKVTGDKAYLVTNAAGDTIPSQLTSDGKLIFQASLKAKEKAEYNISLGEIVEFPAQTFARFIVERKDDFAWENDRVAFRAYGPALVATDGPSNGLDVWYKRTNNMVIDNWYKNDLAGTASYHEDHGEGLDDYKVGRTLGAGAMAPFVNDTLWLNENFVTQELLDNGPLRTTFRLIYKSVNVDGKEYPETRTISIDAGSQLSKVVQEYKGAKDMPVAAGFVKREGQDSIVNTANCLIYAEPISSKVGNVYLGLIFPDGIDKKEVNTYKVGKNTFTHVLAVTTYKDEPITYYTGYAWSKFGFVTLADFEQYTKQFLAQLKQPLVVHF